MADILEIERQNNRYPSGVVGGGHVICILKREVAYAIMLIGKKIIPSMGNKQNPSVAALGFSIPF